jgi:MGT family glycosyltransferase
MEITDTSRSKAVMSKIAYIGFPAHGHTNPTLPVVKELVKRGHVVLYYNAESFREKVAPTGVDFRAFPEPMPPEQEIAEALHEIITTSVIISRMSQSLTHFLIGEMGREQPDLILYDSAAMWGYIAARTHHIPHICFITTFVLDGSQGMIGAGAIARYVWSALPHAPKLLRWRRNMAREFGKENSGSIIEYADVNIVFTSEEFHPKNTFVDERFRFIGPSIDAETRDGDFPFEQLREGTKVYISLGTVYNMDEAFYQTLFTAFADYPAQFILSVGRKTDIAKLGSIPGNFIVCNYVPQLEVLQRVDVFITHGGMNSVHEGFYYHVPEIVIPQQFEQLLNGKRVAQTGAGILLGDRYPYGRVTAQEMREALNTILSSPQYRQQAASIGESLKAAGGYVRAVDEIEAVLPDAQRQLSREKAFA